MSISNNIKKTLSIISAVSILLTSTALPSFADDNKTETVIFPEPTETIEVSPEGSIQEALNNAQDNNDDEYTKVILQEGETYCLDSPLFVYSNTIIEADGATIERTYNGSDKGTGLIRNRANDGTAGYDSKTGGYDVTKNVYINGGTWSGGEMPDTVISSTNIIFCHAENIYLLNAELKNCYQSHLVEFNAVSNGLVQNCSFDGLKRTETATTYMALQIDIAHSYETCLRSDGEHINCSDHDSIPAGYYPDDTACKNIRVLSNSFGTKETDFSNFDTACGSDKTLTDGAGPLSNPGSPVYHEDINISYNTINGCSSSSIASRGHKNVTIKGNTITNGGEKGIILKRSLGGAVSDNTITDTEDIGILVFEKSTLSENNPNRNNTRLDSIQNNTITRSKKQGIAVQDESIIGSISGNNITNSGNHAISVSGQSQITGNIDNNTMKSSQQNGILIYNKSKVNSISNNNISSPSNVGISVSTSSSVTSKISQNTISKAKSHGIIIYEQSSANSIESNSVSDSGSQGIYLYKSSGGLISGNTVSNSGTNGIVLSNNSKTTGNIENNTVSKSGKNGIFIYNSSSTAMIKNNKISDSKSNGIAISTNSSATEITSNTISNSTTNGIVVKVNSKANKISGNTFSNNKTNCKVTNNSHVLQNDCITVAVTSAKPVAAKVVVPKVKKIKSVKVKSTKNKQVKITWKKQSGIDGYVIECSLKKSFKKKKTKTKKVNKNIKTCTIKKLKSNKKYFVRVRAYKKYKANGKDKIAYGSYSKIKNVKVK